MASTASSLLRSQLSRALENWRNLLPGESHAPRACCYTCVSAGTAKAFGRAEDEALITHRERT